MIPENHLDSMGRHRLGKYLTYASIIGAILGTIYWRWYAIPISFGIAFAIAAIYGRIFIDPKIKKIIEEKKSD